MSLTEGYRMILLGASTGGDPPCLRLLRIENFAAGEEKSNIVEVAECSLRRREDN
jgi:hypothetical protein